MAAGFNLTASAERDGVRLIASVFGGTSTPDRNARMTRLLDDGFERMRKGIPFEEDRHRRSPPKTRPR